MSVTEKIAAAILSQAGERSKRQAEAVVATIRAMTPGEQAELMGTDSAGV